MQVLRKYGCAHKAPVEGANIFAPATLTAPPATAPVAGAAADPNGTVSVGGVPTAPVAIPSAAPVAVIGAVPVVTPFAPIISAVPTAAPPVVATLPVAAPQAAAPVDAGATALPVAAPPTVVAPPPGAAPVVGATPARRLQQTTDAAATVPTAAAPPPPVDTAAGPAVDTMTPAPAFPTAADAANVMTTPAVQGGRVIATRGDFFTQTVIYNNEGLEFFEPRKTWYDCHQYTLANTEGRTTCYNEAFGQNFGLNANILRQLMLVMQARPSTLLNSFSHLFSAVFVWIMHELLSTDPKPISV